MQKRCLKPYVKHPKTKKCTKNKKIVEQAECKKNKIQKVMGEFKEGRLRGKNSGTVVSQKQAIAIALSEAKKMCGI